MPQPASQPPSPSTYPKSLCKCTLIPAMVTPFNANNDVDQHALQKLATYLIQSQGCDALLVNGTTGESPTTTFEEKRQILRWVKDVTPNNPVISGSGGNNTLTSIQQATTLVNDGADGLLCVVPYYNKPSQRGMIAHFSAIANAVPNTPIMLYNIPGRTGVLMSPETMLTLHQQHPNIMGVKQSHDDMEAVTTIRQLLPDTFCIWSGDDPLTLPMMSCGAQGVVSVLAHLLGKPIQQMITAYQQGDIQTAQTLHQKLMPLGQALFTLPNPTIVKSVLAKQGHLNANFRLPMLAVNEDEAHLVTHVQQAIDEFSK